MCSAIGRLSSNVACLSLYGLYRAHALVIFCFVNKIEPHDWMDLALLYGNRNLIILRLKLTMTQLLFVWKSFRRSFS